MTKSNTTNIQKTFIKISLIVFNILCIIGIAFSSIFVATDLYYRTTCKYVDAKIESFTHSEVELYNHGSNAGEKYNRSFKGKVAYNIDGQEYTTILQISEFIDSEEAPYTIGDEIPLFCSNNNPSKYFFYESYALYYALFLSLLGIMIIINILYKIKNPKPKNSKTKKSASNTAKTKTSNSSTSKTKSNKTK